MEDSKYILEIRQITKSFPGVKALNGVNLSVKKGEVHAIIGENGAGKSTLMNCILGTYFPDSGEMFFNGLPYTPKSPTDALNTGISMIHQEICLVPTLTVSENIWIGRESLFGNNVFVNKQRQYEATKDILKRLGLSDISPSVLVEKLPLAQMQLVEIARAVSYDSKVIIMDEPTSSLSNNEIEKLYKIIKDLSKEGKSIIFITHKLEELFAICDRVTVLRDGQFIKEMDVKDTSKPQLINLMVGRTLDNVYPKENIEIGKPILEVEGLTQKGVFSDISFQLNEGEILGFSGLIGAGRTEIMEALFGLRKADSGTIKIDGKEIENKSPADAIYKNRMAMVTEDRFHTGIMSIMSVKDNSSATYLKDVTKAGFVNDREEVLDVQQVVKELKIKTPSLRTPIGSLSGGNQQKVIIARWLLSKPRIFILDEPTRGIDVGAKAEIYKLIGQLAKEKKGILFVSSELPELMGICDRIVVICKGQVADIVPRSEFSQERIMTSAFGLKKEKEENSATAEAN